jgi:4,5:9,10-diseco-3-hydroxy-5,9,17-trioxoandrosta-1(10),2-diene-4-oate hydrolase
MGCGGLEDQLTYFQTMSGIQAMTKIPLDSPDFTEAYLKQVLQLIVHDPAFITDELVAERFRILKTQNSSVFKRMVVPNLTEQLHKLEMPILGFWGANDNFCPVSGAQKIVAHCADAQMITLSRCGHWAMIEYQELFNKRCIEFLSAQPALAESAP